MKTNDGGPAFPVPMIPYSDNDGFTEVRERGMTMRDWFAARALQMIVINDISRRPENYHDHYSEGAYKWADAMLRARDKEQA